MKSPIPKAIPSYIYIYCMIVHCKTIPCMASHISLMEKPSWINHWMSSFSATWLKRGEEPIMTMQVSLVQQRNTLQGCQGSHKYKTDFSLLLQGQRNGIFVRCKSWASVRGLVLVWPLVGGLLSMQEMTLWSVCSRNELLLNFLHTSNCTAL